MAKHGAALTESGTGLQDLDESCIKRMSKTRPGVAKMRRQGRQPPSRISSISVISGFPLLSKSTRAFLKHLCNPSEKQEKGKLVGGKSLNWPLVAVTADPI